MGPRSFSVRSIMIASLLVISIIVAGLLSVMMLREWRQLNTLSTASQAVQAVAQMSRAIIEFSLERSLTQVALNLDGPIAPEISQMLEGQRALSDELFARARQTILGNPSIALQDQLVGRLDASLSAIGALRVTADTQMRLPLQQRTASQVVDIPERIKATVLELDDISAGLRGLMIGAPQAILATDRIIQQAWVIREFGGRERTLFAIATARQEPLTRDDIAYMFQSHGKVLQAWWLIEELRDYEALGASVLEGIGRLENAYFGSYQTLRQQLLAASETGNYPVNFQTLFAESEAALQTAIGLLNVAADSNGVLAQAALASAKLKLALEAVVALVVTLVIGFTSWFVIARVIRPVGEMTQAMRRLADNKLEIEIPGLSRRDEIGQMAHAVQIFRDNMKDSDRLRADQAATAAGKAQRQSLIEGAIEHFEASVTQTLQGVVESIEIVGSVARVSDLLCNCALVHAS